jgi:CTP:molybdopterin cytidylyltransferase MocA
MPVAAIILAAGESRRLGRPKQLVTWQGETLLNRAIRMATEATVSPVLVILGAQFEAVRASIESPSAIPVHNDHWRQGMGSSIVTGMRALHVCAPDAAGVVLMGCDQPRLTADHLRALLAPFASADSPLIVASSYAGVQGVPALFPRDTFAELRSLRGEKGARSVIEQASCPIVAIEFEGGGVDIDAPEDLAQLQ